MGSVPTNTNNIEKKPKYICASTVKNQYHLKPYDLDNIHHKLVNNPYYKTAPYMRLYIEDDVIAYVEKINNPEFIKQKQDKENETKKKAVEKKEEEKKQQEINALYVLQNAIYLHEKATKITPPTYTYEEKQEKQGTNITDLPNDILRKIASHMTNDIEYDHIYGPEMATQDCASLMVASKHLYDMGIQGMKNIYTQIEKEKKAEKDIFLRIFPLNIIPVVNKYENDIKCLLAGDKNKIEKMTKVRLHHIAKELGLSGYTTINKDVLILRILQYIFGIHLPKLWTTTSSLSLEVPLLLPYIIIHISQKTIKWRNANIFHNVMIKESCFESICHKISRVYPEYNTDYMSQKKARLIVAQKTNYNDPIFIQKLNDDYFRWYMEKQHKEIKEREDLYKEERKKKEEIAHKEWEKYRTIFEKIILYKEEITDKNPNICVTCGQFSSNMCVIKSCNQCCERFFDIIKKYNKNKKENHQCICHRHRRYIV